MNLLKFDAKTRELNKANKYVGNMGDQHCFIKTAGYMETKKFATPNAATSPIRQKNIFNGISIYVHDLTNPTAYELRRLMNLHGGNYHHHHEHYNTTYIIASELPAADKANNMDIGKIISAKWVVDSIEAGRMLDYTNYLLSNNKQQQQPQTVAAAAAEKKFEKQLQQHAAAEQATLSFKAEIKPTGVNINSVSSPTATNFSSHFQQIALVAELKQFLSKLRAKHLTPNLGEFPARQRLRENLTTNLKLLGEQSEPSDGGAIIMHIEMDCFLVAVALRKQPHLLGQPVAVTHTKADLAAVVAPAHSQAYRESELKGYEQYLKQHLGSDNQPPIDCQVAKMSLSEIATCSYEARAKGIRNGMFVGQALKLCPELKTIPYDFDGYKEVSYTLYNTISQYTLNIEAVSCDEMFVDLSDAIAELQVPLMDFVKALREEIKQKTGCPCSAGVGANKLQARLATRSAKPDGQFYLAPAAVRDYIAKIPAKDLPGIGGSSSFILKNAGYESCGDLQLVSLAKLQNLLGKKVGETIYQYCRGFDQRSLNYEQFIKSPLALGNCGLGLQTNSSITRSLRQLCADAHAHLRRIKRQTKCLTLKLKIRAANGACVELCKSKTFAYFTDEREMLTTAALEVLKTFKQVEVHGEGEVREIGLDLTKLNHEVATVSVATNEVKTCLMQPKKMKRDVPDLLPCSQMNLRSKKLRLLPAAAPEVPTVTVSAAPKSILSDDDDDDEYLDMSNLPADIDMGVFVALPIEIRKEIIAENRANGAKSAKAPTAAAAAAAATAKTAIKDGAENAPINSDNSDLAELDFRPSTSQQAQQRLAVNHRQIEEEVEEEKTKDKLSKTNHSYFQRISPSQSPPTQPSQQQQQQPNIDDDDDNIHLEIYMVEAEAAAAAAAAATSNCNNNNNNSIISTNNIFALDDCKKLLYRWIKAQPKPNENDVKIICEHALEMVPQHFEHLIGILLHLRQLILNQSYDGWHMFNAPADDWMQAYSDIIQSVLMKTAFYFPERIQRLQAALKL